MKAIRGDKLSAKLRQHVLAAFVHRHTVEHYCALGYIAEPPPATETDAEWLANHAFYVTAKGTLSARHTHCVPACMSD